MLIVGEQAAQAGTMQLSAVVHEGIRINHPDGKPCRIAIIDENGQVVAGGEDVTKAVFDVAIGAFQNLMKARGHLRTYSKPINTNPIAA